MSMRFMLPGTKEIKPLTQGDLSRLCGLYSWINGLQLRLYPQRVRATDLQDLFICAVSGLSRRRQLNRVIGRGMPTDVWLQLGEQIIKSVNATYATSLALRPLLTGSARHSRRDAIGGIKRVLESGSPVLACFGGALDHYSVICGCTDHRLFLFDSSGFRCLVVRGIGLGERSVRRHWILPATLVALVDDW